jgi:hypothetical protein
MFHSEVVRRDGIVGYVRAGSMAIPWAERWGWR